MGDSVGLLALPQARNSGCEKQRGWRIQADSMCSELVGAQPSRLGTAPFGQHRCHCSPACVRWQEIKPCLSWGESGQCRQTQSRLGLRVCQGCNMGVC